MKAAAKELARVEPDVAASGRFYCFLALRSNWRIGADLLLFHLRKASDRAILSQRDGLRLRSETQLQALPV